jgi:predicted RNA binding protein YcfA (HicA-like mRNA interferase family)
LAWTREFTDSTILRYDQFVKVRDLIRKLESGGWALRSTRGSHRQFKHPQSRLSSRWPVTPGKGVPIGTLRAILKAADLEGD